MATETAAKPLVLVGVEDVDFYLLLDHVLKADDFATLLASDLEETLELAAGRTPDIILLDCRPQSYPATETCSRLKQDPQTKHIPVIALISPGAERDHVRLMKSGVNDSFSRPIVPAKLVEHLRATLGAARPVAKKGLLRYVDIEMCLGTYRVRRDGQDVHLSPDELAGAAWREGVFVSPRTVDVHMGRLRKALKSVSHNDLIRTVRSIGYALVDEFDGDGTPNK
jgi:two-component system phosphate regulon response regulator PhoB